MLMPAGRRRDVVITHTAGWNTEEVLFNLLYLVVIVLSR